MTASVSCDQGLLIPLGLGHLWLPLVSADSWHLPPSLVSLSLYLETPLLRWATGLNGPPLESAEHSGDAIFPLHRCVKGNSTGHRSHLFLFSFGIFSIAHRPRFTIRKMHEIVAFLLYNASKNTLFASSLLTSPPPCYILELLWGFSQGRRWNRLPCLLVGSPRRVYILPSSQGGARGGKVRLEWDQMPR